MSIPMHLSVVLQIAAACPAPGLPVELLAAVAQQESGLHPFAIRDERDNRSYYPGTAQEAEELAERLTAQGHLLGVGLMQLTPPAAFGLTLAEALDPCRNMRAGAALLQRAVREALSRYNSNHPTRGAGYARSVEARVASLRRADPPSPDRPTPAAAPPKEPPVPVMARRGAGRELVFPSHHLRGRHE